MANVHLRSNRRMIASFIVVSMLLPMAAGCRKKSEEKSKNDLYVSGREILSTDPFFDSTVSELKIPVDENKELESKHIGTFEPMGDYLVASYTVDYKVPEELVRKQEHPEDMTEADFQEVQEYYIEGTAVFNMQGELVRELEKDGDTLFAIASDSENHVCLLRYVHDSFYMTNNIAVLVYDMEGQLKEQIILKDPPVDIPGMSGSTLPEDDFEKRAEESDYEVVFDPFDDVAAFSSVKMQVLNDGSFLFSDKGTMSIYDRQGNKRCTVADPDRKLLKNAFLKGDKYYVLSVLDDKEKGRNVQIKNLDINTGALGKGKNAEALSEFQDPVVTEKGIFLNSLNGCSQYDIDSDTVNEVFNWNDTDVNRSILYTVRCFPESGDKLNAVAFGETSTEPYLIQLTRAEKNPHAGKKIIRIGGMHLSGDVNLMTFISQYNADPAGKTRAAVIDYTQDRDLEVDSSETVQKLYLDILSGEGPDIVVNMGDSEMFRNSRILEDMNPYLDGADGIDRTKYFDNIFRACERDGKLYHIPIDFSLEGLMVNTDLISCEKGWTFDEFSEVAKALPEDVNILPLSTYNELLRLLLGTEMSRFMNYQDQTVNFQNEEMKKLLKLVREYGVNKVLPSERKGVETEYYEDGSVSKSIVDYTEEKLKEGILATKNVSIGSVYNIPFEGRLIPGHAGFLGYPSFTGTGMAIHPERTLGILSSSKYKDLAWDLIRAYLEYDNENTGDYRIPVNRDSFEKQCRKVMDDANKQFKEQSEQYFWLASLFVEVHEEDIDTLRTLVENADTAVFRDEAVYSIIAEEAAGYFAGDRTQDDVLSIIQNRASIVVKEK